MNTGYLGDWPPDVGTVLVNYGAGRIPCDITSSSTSGSILSVLADQDRLNKAKTMLIERIFPYEPPSPADLTDMIEACGVALNRQIDCDNGIFGKPQQNLLICRKITCTGLKPGKDKQVIQVIRQVQESPWLLQCFPAFPAARK